MNMPRKVPKVVSKLCRLRLTDEIGRVIRQLPVRGLEETQVGNHVYMGTGKIRIGSLDYDAKVRIWIDDGRMMAAVKALGAGLNVSAAMTELPEAVQVAARRCLN